MCCCDRHGTRSWFNSINDLILKLNHVIYLCTARTGVGSCTSVSYSFLATSFVSLLMLICRVPSRFARACRCRVWSFLDHAVCPLLWCAATDKWCGANKGGSLSCFSLNTDCPTRPYYSRHRYGFDQLTTPLWCLLTTPPWCTLHVRDEFVRYCRCLLLRHP